jgi:hypothetical protein
LLDKTDQKTNTKKIVFGNKVYRQSEISKQIFRSSLTQLNPKLMLLDNPDAMNFYHRLSEGEKILALHKTFEHLKTKTEVFFFF